MITDWGMCLHTGEALHAAHFCKELALLAIAVELLDELLHLLELLEQTVDILYLLATAHDAVLQE